MAGALSLQEDIWALVKKHSETCLPEDLLARLAEDARLLACGEGIRSMHQGDPFGLFSEPRDDEEEEEDEGKGVAEGEISGGGEKAGAAVLPDNVKHMLETMKINRLDKVAALNGFSAIDAEVEFSRAKKPANAAEKHLQGALTLSSATIAAAAKAAVAEAGTVSSQEEDEEEDPEAPLFLTFRFRREPLPKIPEQGPGTDVGSGSGEVINLAMDDEEEEPPTAVATSHGGGVDGSGGGGGEASGGEGTTGSNGDASDGDAKEGRKRAGSRGLDGESRGGGGGGRGKVRKRAKSTGGMDGGAAEDEQLEELELDQEEDGGDEEGGVDGGGGERCQAGCCPDDAEAGTCKTGCCGDNNELEGVGLDYEPRTIVSYSISGGIGFKQPAEMLLQAVVYARGDGPACVMPPPWSGEKKDDGGGGGGDSDEDDEDEEGSVSTDQEDVFDCNVDGPALAAVGRALGLHTGDEDSSSSDSDSDSDAGSNVEGGDGGGGGKAEEAQKKKGKKTLPPRLSAGSGAESEALGAGGGGGPGGMTLSDLVWWLLMFPFFEKEFDIVEVVASSVFGEDDSGHSDDGGRGGSDDSDDSGGEGSDGGVVRRVEG